AIAATTSGVTNCTPRAALNTAPTAVVRTGVGKSSVNIGPKFDHVPVPNPTSARQARRSGGHASMCDQRSVIDTSPAAMIVAYGLNAGFRPHRSDTTPNDAYPASSPSTTTRILRPEAAIESPRSSVRYAGSQVYVNQYADMLRTARPNASPTTARRSGARRRASGDVA